MTDSDSNEQVKQFMDELRGLINRVRKEYDFSYATLVGCLYLIAAEMIKEVTEIGDG